MTNSSTIGYVYDFAYYVCYRFEDRILITRSYPVEGIAASILTIIVSFNLLINARILLTFIDSEFTEDSYHLIFYFIAITAILFFYNYNRFVKNDKYLAIIEKYGKENFRKKVIAAAIVGFLGILPWAETFYHSFASKWLFYSLDLLHICFIAAMRHS